MKTATLKVVTNDGITRKPVRVKGRVMNYNTDRRLKKNRGKKKVYAVRMHLRSRKEHSKGTVFLCVKAPAEQLKTSKSMLKALGCTFRVVDI